MGPTDTFSANADLFPKAKALVSGVTNGNGSFEAPYIKEELHSRAGDWKGNTKVFESTEVM